ncbi:MAG: sporulation protein YtfJ [Clostridiales bacterium]|nr:sporulation protein YtfJ [Clostridiales bacterium]
MQHPIDNMMQTTMENIRSMVDVNTVVGSPVLGTKGTTIIPISKVSFGFIAGGGEYAAEDSKNKAATTEGFPFAGGTGAGVSVQPVGFLVVGDGAVKMLPAQSNSPMERIVELLPQLIEDLGQSSDKPDKKKTKKVTKTQVETLDFDTEEDDLLS